MPSAAKDAKTELSKRRQRIIIIKQESETRLRGKVCFELKLSFRGDPLGAVLTNYSALKIFLVRGAERPHAHPAQLRLLSAT